MKFHPMSKRDVIAAWARLVADVRASNARSGHPAAPCTAGECTALLGLPHAGARVSNLRTFSKAWAGEVAAKVRGEAP
jgi:hypothetical protein